MKEANPIGQVVQVQAVEEKVNNLLEQWKTENPTPISWWDKVKNTVRISYSKVIKFLIYSLDELILIVDDVIDFGPDKKATVLAAIAILYDRIIAVSMPVWLKPFNSVIKSFVIMVIISSTIDFIVEKYRNGTWKIQTPTS